MNRRIRVQLLSRRPYLSLDGEEIKLQGPSLDLFVYLALENKAEYERESLRKELFGYGADPEYFRSGIIGRIDKRLKSLCLPETERGLLLWDNRELWVDALVFQKSFDNARYLPPGSWAYQEAMTEAYHLYQSGFLSQYETPWLKWQTKQRQGLQAIFSQIAEVLVRQQIAYFRYEQAASYAEGWYRACPESDTVLQYLIWLSLNLQQYSRAASYLESLAVKPQPSALIGLLPEGWYQAIEEKRLMGLELIGFPTVEIQMEDWPPIEKGQAKSELQILKAEKDIPGLITEASQEIKSGQFQQAKAKLQEASAVSIQSESLDWLSEIYHQEGILAIKEAKYAQAEEWLEKAMAFPQRAPYLRNQSGILSNLGTNAFFQKAYRRAEHFFQQAEQAAVEAAQPLVQGHVKSSLALVASQTERRQLAFVYYQQALEQFQQLGHDEQSAYSFFNMAQALYAEQNVLAALPYLERGARLVRSLNYPELLALWRWYQGAFKLALKDFTSAEFLLNSGMEIAFDAHLVWLEGAIHVELGKVFLAQHNWQVAWTRFEGILEFALEKGSLDYTAKALYGLSLNILDEAYPIGRRSLDYSVAQLHRKLPGDLIGMMKKLPLRKGHFLEAEKLFGRGMQNFFKLERYCLVDALGQVLLLED